MKISKIPGLGRFGIFIDDLDINNLSDEEWAEIGRLHLESLVTIIRNVNLTAEQFNSRITKWGNPTNLYYYRMVKKYRNIDVSLLMTQDTINDIPVDPEDRKWAFNVSNIRLGTPGADATLKISGKKDKDGNPLGMFAEGELLWHSNESGNLCFSPGVALLGREGMEKSSTGFITTTDWYEEQSESFRSELDEMVIEHTFTPGKINPGLRADQDDLMYKNMCPVPTEIPLVIQSPNGIRGLHYSVNTVNSIKGMSKTDAQSIFKQINDTLFVDKYIYDHWYTQNNDLCLFDNSITLHRRLGGISDRLAYRIQYRYDNISPELNPYLKEPYASLYSTEMADINKTLGRN